jgi:glucose-1-phosphate thymidylyltransferase
MHIIVFEDLLVSRLYPAALGRPAYSLSCGSYRLVDWLLALADEARASLRGVVRPHLVELQKFDFPALNAAPAGANGRPGYLFVNARLVPAIGNWETLRKIIADQRPGVVRQGESIAAALVTHDAPALPAHPDPESIADLLSAVAPRLAPLETRLALLTWPHDIVRQNMEIIGDNLAHRLHQGEFREVADGVFAAGSAALGPHCVTDTSKGPILLEDGVTVGPFCFLRGPAYIGPRTKITEHAAIKDAVSLGHTVKIGGEVEASVIEPYTNKQHHGFLGHSYLGSWINLGAGTCNSDLKNTYGQVKLDYRGEQVATGMQFVGCMMGDYAKTAINTGIFTGKVIGVCSMMYGFVTTNVPSFVNYARLFGQVTELPAEVMIATQQRMFARRNVTPRPCDVQLIHAMYELTRHERQLAGEPLAL